VTTPPTIYEVARRCGVSTATVSRVVNDRRGFSEATRKRVLAAAEELGWVANSSARDLAGGRAGLLGLLFPDLGKPADAESESALFVDQVIRGAERAATLAGRALVLAGARGRAGRQLVNALAPKVDGLVVVPRAVPAAKLAEVSSAVPVVVLSPLGLTAPLDFVTTENRQAVRDLVAHLTSHHGYRDLAFIAGPPGSPDSTERFRGFQDGLADAGLDVPRKPDQVGRFTENGGEAAVDRLLDARPRPPRAIVLGNDEMAVGALRALARRGLSVPKDVALTGFDDITAARHVRPALTTVRQPMRAIGEQAVHVLLARIADPAFPRHTVVLPTELVVRRSCGCRTSAPERRRTYA
jgi:LacI family transcriptional regulator